MNSVVRELVLERLEASDLGDEPARFIEAACAGEAVSDAVAPPVWLQSVTVEGFRGIGAPARLRLDPAPGLTVVVGRNGSGKSSFAEGLELLMTGALKRWEKRPKAWTETWQCLHHDGPTRLSAELLLEGGETVELAQEWARGAAWNDAPAPGHAWTRELGSFRPFLSYAELATMFDTLTSLYDALTPVLGLGDLDEVAAKLSAARLEIDRRRKDVKALHERLLARLDGHPDDARAAQLRAAVAARRPDFAAIDALLTGAPASDAHELAGLRRLAGMSVPEPETIEEAHAELRGAEAALQAAASLDATRAGALARLLRQALEVGGEDCPVCGTATSWAEHAREHADELDREARELSAAQARVSAARRAVDGLFAGMQNVAAAALDLDLEVGDLVPGEPVGPAQAGALRAVAERAAAELGRRDTIWHELSSAASEWLDAARAVAGAADTLKALRDAEKWLKETATALRAERFAPIAGQAIANWRELRQGSSVDLHEITLTKVGRGGRADFDVRADGVEANALGVMSQGELLALSVSVFLPRAALAESPFRFAVIDDPVQAMDPAKVDGLARVLHRAARTRQLVVFTHDDRLPEAIRRLRLDATILRVDRRARSTVAVEESRSPVQRYLDGARRYAVQGRLPAEVQARVVPMFCRSALEAAAADVVRRRAVRDGGSLEQADAALDQARTLRETLALALFDDAGRAGEVARSLGTTKAAVVTALNAGVHETLDAGVIAKLPDRTRDLIGELMA